MSAERNDDDRPGEDPPLSDRIARAKAVLTPPREESFAVRHNMASMAWRMTLEFVVGALLGFGVGWSLDQLAGTTPLFLIVFGLFGVAAGMKVVMGTAKEMQRPRSEGESAAGDTKPPADGG